MDGALLPSQLTGDDRRDVAQCRSGPEGVQGSAVVATLALPAPMAIGPAHMPLMPAELAADRVPW